jgi:hypothetical protein
MENLAQQLLARDRLKRRLAQQATPAERVAA